MNREILFHPRQEPSLPGLLRALALGLGSATLIAFCTLFMPNYYRSDAKILPTDGQGQSAAGGLMAAAAAFGVTIPSGGNSDPHFVEILQSRWMRERLLARTYSYRSKSWLFGPPIERKEPLSAYLEAPNLDIGISKVGSIMGVSKDIKTRVISLSVETRSPELSQAVANEALRLLESFVQEKGRNMGSAKATFAEARLKEAQAGLTQAEGEFIRFTAGNRNYQISGDPAIRLKGVRLEAELKLRQQLVANLTLSIEQALMEEKGSTPLVNILDSANLPIQKSRPSRASLVFMAFILVTASSWILAHRRFLKERFLEQAPDRA